MKPLEIFNHISPKSSKIFGDFIFWAIQHEFITREMIKLKYGDIGENAINESLDILLEAEIIRDISKVQLVIEPTVPEDLHPMVLELMINSGHSPAEISEAFEGLPLAKKKRTSNILMDNTHKWKSVDDKSLEENTEYVVRIVNPEKIYLQTRLEVIYVEDVKIAKKVNGEWELVGPHPRYDFSPCSNKDKLKDGCKITHFAPVNDDQLNGWKHRFDLHHDYSTLNIEVDKNHDFDVYHSLIIAAGCVMKEYQCSDDNGMKDKLMAAYVTLCDLQSVMDLKED